MQNLPPRLIPVTWGSLESSLILGGSPMHTSPAYPTSVPSSDVVARDNPAIDARIEARRQDATAGFPVGLIPQLIDVLHILTEGQSFLSGKIRAARLDESDHSIPNVEQLDRFQIPVEQSVVGRNSASLETPRPRPAERTGFYGQATRVSTISVDCPSVPGLDFGGTVASPASVPGSAPSSDPTRINIKEAGRSSSGPHVDSVPLEPATPDGTTALRLHRDYNFFDELDARLATLQDPTG